MTHDIAHLMRTSVEDSDFLRISLSNDIVLEEGRPTVSSYAKNFISENSDDFELKNYTSQTCAIFYQSIMDIPGTLASIDTNSVFNQGGVRHRFLNVLGATCGGVAHIDTRPNWLQVAESTQNELALELLKVIALEINVMLRSQKFSLVDYQISKSNVRKMGIDAIVAILRVSYAARNKLTHWLDFLERSDSELRNRGYSGRSLENIRLAAAR